MNEIEAGVIVELRTVDVHIKQIRQALQKAATAAGVPTYGIIIETVRNVGYRKKEILQALDSSK